MSVRSLAHIGFFLCAASAQAQVAPPSTPPGSAGRGIVGGVIPDLELVAKFDRDADKRLDAAERRAAIEYLTANPQLKTPPSRGGGRGAMVPGTPGRRLTPADVKSYSTEPVFDPGTLRTLFLEFDEPSWEQQMVAFHRTDVDVPVSVTVDGKKYAGVGAHFRGNNSFGAVPDGLKRSITLSFDFENPDQNLNGYRSLHLLNSNQDPTFLRSVLYLDVMRDYMPALKANFMRVVINGESWGVYVNQQPFDKDLLRDAFGTTKGTRIKSPNNSRGGGFNYLGEDVAAYKRWYEMRSKDEPKAWADLVKLCRILNQTPPDRLAAALEPVLNVESALKFIALDNALTNNDGYWNDGSDFNLYYDEKGRFHLLPHDVNEGFRGSSRSGGGAKLEPFATESDTNKALLNKLLKAPELRARYLGYIRDISERWLDWNRLGPIVERYQALIAADVAADTRKLMTTVEFTTGVYGDSATRPSPPPSTLKGFADQRRAFLLSHPGVSAAVPRR